MKKNPAAHHIKNPPHPNKSLSAVAFRYALLVCGMRISRTQASFIEAIRILDTLKETHDTRKVRSEFEGTVKSHPRSRQDGAAQDVLAELKEFESALDAQANLAMRRIMGINFVVFLVAIGAGNMSTIIDPRAGVATTADLFFAAPWKGACAMFFLIQIPILLNCTRVPWIHHLLVTSRSKALLMASAEICFFGAYFLFKLSMDLTMSSNGGPWEFTGLIILSAFLFFAAWVLAIRHVKQLRKDARGTCDWCACPIHDVEMARCTECGMSFEELIERTTSVTT
jgi:hypothetical protein